MRELHHCEQLYLLLQRLSFTPAVRCSLYSNCIWNHAIGKDVVASCILLHLVIPCSNIYNLSRRIDLKKTITSSIELHTLTYYYIWVYVECRCTVTTNTSMYRLKNKRKNALIIILHFVFNRTKVKRIWRRLMDVSFGKRSLYYSNAIHLVRFYFIFMFK